MAFKIYFHRIRIFGNNVFALFFNNPLPPNRLKTLKKPKTAI